MVVEMEVPPWLKALPLAPEYHPTEEEFLDPIGYINKIEKEATRFGICKIVPPYLKAPKRVVINNLNSSLAQSHDAPPTNQSGSSVPLSRSMCPTRSMGGVLTMSSYVEAEVGGKARFTTRRQQLGWNPRKPRAPFPLALTHKLVWQSGETYTLDQFEAKAKLFSRNRLGTAREVPPLTLETFFWRAACEKAINVEYANDISGSAFAEPSDPAGLTGLNQWSSKGDLGDVPDWDLKTLREQQGEEDKVILGVEDSQVGDQSALWKGTGLNVGVDSSQVSECKISNSAWNMRIVARSPGSLLRFMPDEVPGVTTPMVYIGMLFSWFAWHVEDHELHSLNYLHTGAPKTWYAVPGEAAPALEEVVRVHGYGGQLDSRDAFARLGEKTTLMSPEVVIAAGVPCCRLVQNAGEYVVTFPRAYHQGFSHGFNCGEAVNLATPGWLDVAREAAARRAAMNYLPMLSHQQLLYMQAMSLLSRSPNNKECNSRLNEKKKAGEDIVKSVFVNDVIHHNKLLGMLLNRGDTSCLMMRDTQVATHHMPNISDASVPPNPSNIEHNLKNTVREHVDLLSPYLELDTVPNGEAFKGSLTDSTLRNYPCLDAPISSLDSNSSAGEQEDEKDKEDGNLCSNVGSSINECKIGKEIITSLLPLEWGTLPCAACGMLCYSGMAVVQPSQTAAKVLKPLQSHVIGAGNVAEFHRLPSPGLVPVIEFRERTPSDRLVDNSHKDRDGEQESITDDFSEKLTSSTLSGNKAMPDTKGPFCSAPLSPDRCDSLTSEAEMSAADITMQGAHMVSDKFETITVPKGQRSTVSLEDVPIIPFSVLPDMIGLGTTSRVHSDVPERFVDSPAAANSVSSLLDGFTVRASDGGVSSVQEVVMCGAEQQSDKPILRSKIGNRNGDVSLSSLQLLAAVYEGDSEVDEVEREEEREDTVEEVGIVGVPHVGTGGRDIDSVGLSADAPWDGISQILPSFDLSLHHQDSEASYRFTLDNVLSAFQAMAKIFSSGGVLFGGVHQGYREHGREFQTTSTVPDVSMEGLVPGGCLQSSDASTLNKDASITSKIAGKKFGFASGLEYAKETAVSFGTVHPMHLSSCSGGSPMNNENLGMTQIGDCSPQKDDYAALQPTESETNPKLGEVICCPEVPQLHRCLTRASEFVKQTSMGPLSIDRIHVRSSPCGPPGKLSNTCLGARLKGDGVKRLILPIGECVTCSQPHDSFFDSFEEMAVISSYNGVKCDKGCAESTSALVGTDHAKNVEFDLAPTLLEVGSVNSNNFVKAWNRPKLETAGPRMNTGSNICDDFSDQAGEAANVAQALDGSVGGYASSTVNVKRGLSLEAEELHGKADFQVDEGMLYEGALMPRVLCLEHAAIAQHLLEQYGGAHVVIICHSNFAIAEQHAKEAASKMGIAHMWKLIPIRKAGDKELGIVTAAIEAEVERLQGLSDWVGQLGLSSHNLDNTYTVHLDKGLVTEQGIEGRGSRAGGGGRKMDQWCGIGWRPDELHPLMGGCRYMVSSTEVTVLPSVPGSLNSHSENGRPRRMTRLTRLSENNADGQPQFEVRKSGRKRRTVLDSAVDHSDEEGEEQNKLVTIVCHNIGKGISGKRTVQSSGLDRNQLDEHALPTPEKHIKHRKIYCETAISSPHFSVNLTPESILRQGSGCSISAPHECQSDSPTINASFPPPSNGNVAYSGRKNHTLSAAHLALAPIDQAVSASLEPDSRTRATPVDELGRNRLTLRRTSTNNSTSSDTPFVCSPDHNWDQTLLNKRSEGQWTEANVTPVGSPMCLSGGGSDQPSHDEALGNTQELQFPAEITVGESATHSQPCPGGHFLNEASNCCSVVGGFLQRGAKLQALQKLCRLRPPLTESSSHLITPTRISSQETLSCSNVTTPRLTNRFKRKPASGTSLQSVKKPKHKEGSKGPQDARLSWDRENSSHSSITPYQAGHGEVVKRQSGVDSEEICPNYFTTLRQSDSRVEENDTAACNMEAEQGNGIISCRVVESAPFFKTGNRLPSHWQACHTVPPQNQNINCTSSRVPDICQRVRWSSPQSEATIMVPRWNGRARGRRTKGLGWKSYIRMSSPGPDEERNLSQTWNENPSTRDLTADGDLDGKDCGSGVDTDPDFSPYLSCLTSTSSRLRRRRARTPEWEGVENEGFQEQDVGDCDPDEEAEDDIKSRKRKKPRKTTAQKRLQDPEGEFQCDIDGCTMGFDTEQDLQLHKRNRCTWKGCGKHFHMHKYLLQHRRVHLDDRPLKCPWKGCPQAFKWAWARTEHIRVHTGERPYKCTVSGCGQTFRFVSDFSRHKRNTGHRPS